MNFHLTDGQFHHNPTINAIIQFLVCTILTIAGSFGENIVHFLNTPIPVGIMNFFQILAWSSAFGLFLVGLIKLFKENKNDKTKVKQD